MSIRLATWSCPEVDLTSLADNEDAPLDLWVEFDLEDHHGDGTDRYGVWIRNLRFVRDCLTDRAGVMLAKTVIVERWDPVLVWDYLQSILSRFAQKDLDQARDELEAMFVSVDG